ncbi:MAG: 2-C-methyl-D-erythritol 4-phosphate cytidylyltransferase [Sulfuricella sp.]|nr:2-C-methyl-D-erythritol 4-phosphate cytidylyltransferase [Sulfuricella sp.]
MPNYYAVIPAAGSGARMGGELPKQYLPLNGQPMIYHAVARLCGYSGIARVFVVLAPADAWWDRYDWSAFAAKLTVLRCGGAERFESVRNGLEAIMGEVGSDDWVLVHDAARPCLTDAQLDSLISEVGDDAFGGILAQPVADTIKRGDADQRVVCTEPRERLWQAQTPQMFRYVLLQRALSLLAGEVVTDEAQAVEKLGFQAKLVASDSSNFKVTYPRDLKLAEWLLREGLES